jgi:hypothetical protein
VRVKPFTSQVYRSFRKLSVIVDECFQTIRSQVAGSRRSAHESFCAPYGARSVRRPMVWCTEMVHGAAYIQPKGLSRTITEYEDIPRSKIRHPTLRRRLPRSKLRSSARSPRRAKFSELFLCKTRTPEISACRMLQRFVSVN